MNTEKAQQPYRPGSAFEAIAFNNRWCCRCAKSDEDGPCDLFALATLFAIDEPEYPVELRYGPNGQPECTTFEEVKTS